MDADHRRKGLNSAAADISLREKPRVKKKQAGSSEANGFSVKPHVSLEWDAHRKRVIARREQVGLSWRNLRPFAEPLPRGHKILADAIDVPAELFKLENLEDLLSYEVWQTCLSERERRFLAQFLPRETEPQHVVKQLLAGGNFHFGNPFLDWAASLQSGNLHPDAIVHREQSLKAEKSAYFSELHRYHNNMIGSLLKMKEKWQSSKGLENEYNQKNTRSRNGKQKKFSYVDPSEFHDLDESFAGTSKSSSLGTEERTSNSGEQFESFKNAGVSQKRISTKRPVKDGNGNPPIASEDLPTKGVRLKKRNIVYNDGTKYMSYVKISKKQHELAKSMEQSGSSMQSRSLGNLANLHIQPYEVFVEEQRKKLHDHWLRLANHDLPSAYEIWNDIHFQRQQMMRSLEKELLEKHDSLVEVGKDEIMESEHVALKGHEAIDERLAMEEDRDSLPSPSQEQDDTKGAASTSSMENVEESIAPVFVDCPREDDGEEDREFSAKNHNDSLPSSLHETEAVTSSMLSPSGLLMREDANSVPAYSQERYLNELPSSSSCNPSFNHVIPESEILKHPEPEILNRLQPEILKSGSAPQGVTAYPGDMNGDDLIGIGRVPLSHGSSMWQPVSCSSSVPLTYFDSSSVGCQFNSVADIPLPASLPPINGEQRPPQWIDLDSNLHGQVQQLHTDSSSYVSYPNHQNELLQSIFSGQQGMLHPVNGNNQQKHIAPMNFQLPNGVLHETYGQRMQNSIQQNMATGNLLPNGGGSRFLMQQRQQDHILPPSISVQEWSHHSTPSLHPLPTLSGPNWFSNPSELQVRGGGGWAGSSGVPSQTNNLVVDQSMYGVLPPCNQLPSRSPSYDSMEQFIPSRSYGHGIMSGTSMGNVLPNHAAPPPLDYMNRRDEETGWMSLPPHQNSSMNDPMGKPSFLGSWNQ